MKKSQNERVIRVESADIESAETREKRLQSLSAKRNKNHRISDSSVAVEIEIPEQKSKLNVVS